MKIIVNKKLKPRKIETETYDFGWLPMLKHIGCVGSGFRPNISKLLRSIGFYFYYKDFLNNRSLRNNHFSEPPDYLYDPTEKANFSNIIGKAVADYLAKRIYNTKLTQTYESAMLQKNLKISGKRPDLLCFTDSDQFAIESKGYSINSISADEMRKHKRQSKSGPLKVSYSVASVTYGIFTGLKNNFYDPPGEENVFDLDLYNSLAFDYYNNFFIDPLFKDSTIDEVSIGDNVFLSFRIYPFFFEIFPEILYKKTFYDHLFRYKYSILIDKRIPKLIESKDFSTYNYSGYKDEVNYIDNDGIGIAIKYAHSA